MKFVQVLLLAAALAVGATVDDDSLYDKVRIQLANDREIGGGKIDVKVENGVVELTGKVKSEKQRQRAEKVAKKVKGVQKVVNSLQVGPA